LGRSGKGNIKVIQRFLRHDDLASTARYLHVFDEDIRAAMEAETEARQNPLQIPLQDVKKKA
jgi:hypothetical protein